MKTPPKRSIKVYKKMELLSAMKVGDAKQLRERVSRWRQALNLHHTENKTIFSIRTTPKGIFICRKK